MLEGNWADLYEALRDVDPSAEAIIQGSRRVTWGEFDDRAGRIGQAFARFGLEPRQRVAMLIRDCPEYLETVYGALKVRLVPIAINTRYRADEIRYLLQDSGARVVVVSEEYAGRIAELESGDLDALIQIKDGTGAGLVSGARWYHDVLETNEPCPRIERSGDDWFMLYTGGTTGMPKGVVWLHRDLLNVMWGSARATGADDPRTARDVATAAAVMRSSGTSPVLMICPPLMHGMGVFQAMSALLRGGRVVLRQGARFDASEALLLVEREAVTDMTIVGDAFARPLVESLDELAANGQPVDLSSLRAIMSSGAGWSHATKVRLRHHAEGVALSNVLGATEGGPFAQELTPPGVAPAAEPCFTLAPTCTIIDDDGSTIEPGSGRVGRIAFSGICATEYFGDPQRTAATFQPVGESRRLVLGDYAVVGADGCVRFLGRGSGCINTGGEKVYAEEVEELLKTHPQVIDCLVIGVPDERFGEAVTAVVRVTGDVSDQELIDHVGSRVAGFKRPRHVVRVEEVPRTPTGKGDHPRAKAAALSALGLGES